jgi:FkbM family methyltransferase
MKLPVASLVRALPMPGGTKVQVADMVSRRIESSRSSQAETRMSEGFRMSLNLAAVTERNMYYAGIYEPWLTFAFKQIIRPGDTVIDAGANIGFFSLLAAKCVGKTGAVHAFEPIPATFARLSENIGLNTYTNITLNRMALASQAGELEFEVPQEIGTNLTLDRLATSVITGQGQRVRVQASTLDEYVAKAGIGPIKFAKFDIEGGEVSAVKGMQAILSAHQIAYLICEVNVPLLEHQGLPPSALRDAFAAHGYEAHYFDRIRGRRRPVHVNFIPVSQLPQPDVFGEYLFVAPGMPVPRL